MKNSKNINDFIAWLKKYAKDNKDTAQCSASSLNWGRHEASNKIYAQAKKLLNSKSAKKTLKLKNS